MDLRQKLEMIDLFIANDTCMALSSLAAQRYMQQSFYGIKDDSEQRRLFKTNIANTYAYRLA